MTSLYYCIILAAVGFILIIFSLSSKESVASSPGPRDAKIIRWKDNAMDGIRNCLMFMWFKVHVEVVKLLGC